ncbi:MAG: hypothetical protein FJ290_09540 [Planctomycetes bacterium]|nr:hypothetical protein [Planctomycetota bacterium]
MQLWVWRGIRIELPEDWEMLQFSRSAQAGRCAWADRYQFRAELSWQAVNGPLDMKRLASDYLAKLRLDGTMPDAAPARVGDWHGLRRHDGEQAVSRFSRYLALVTGKEDRLKAGLRTEGCLVELVLLWPGELETALEASILGSVGAEPGGAGGLRRWRAFGLDALASDGLDMVECVVQPALARLVFRDARGTRSETFERLGMLPQWLHGSVGEWLRRQLPHDVEVQVAQASCLCRQAGGHEVEVVEGLRRGGLFRGPTRYAAAAWLCPRDGRLYHVSISGPSVAANMRQGLSCCEGMTLGG